MDIRFPSFAHTPAAGGRRQGDFGLGRPADRRRRPTQTYYLARVAVTPEGCKKLGKRQLQPGMPVEVVFKTGERSLLTYLLHPLTKRIAASMKEE